MLLRKRAQMDKSNKKKMGRACSLKALLGIIKTCTYGRVYMCGERVHTLVIYPVFLELKLHLAKVICRAYARLGICILLYTI